MAASSTPASAADCPEFDVRALETSLRGIDVVVAARVRSVEPGQTLVLVPEVFLKGSVTLDLVLRPVPDAPRECAARFQPGERVLVFLSSEGGTLAWPAPSASFLLKDGRARNARGEEERSEAEFLRAVRAVTDQYAVPAQTTGEGASIDWLGTVAWVAGALAVVFVIGLALMRTWHRIDPS
jgi:hypothetical protein